MLNRSHGTTEKTADCNPSVISRQLPAKRDAQQERKEVITGKAFDIRLTVQISAGQQSDIVGLQLVAKDYNYNDAVRRFDLSDLLSYYINPTVVPGAMDFIRDPKTTEAGRREALKDLLPLLYRGNPSDSIAGIEERSGNAAHSSPNRQGDSAVTIRPVLSQMSLDELLSGVQKQCFAVLGGDGELLRFIIERQDGSYKRAEICFSIAGKVTAPLLDKDGCPVRSIDSANAVIDRLFSIARTDADRASLEIVTAVAKALEEQQPSNSDGKPARNYHIARKVALGYRNSVRSQLDSESWRSPVELPFAFNPGVRWLHSELGEGRRLWFGVEREDEYGNGLQLCLAGEMPSGVPYAVSFECPAWLPTASRYVGAAIWKSCAPPRDLDWTVKRLIDLPGTVVTYEAPRQPWYYPSWVNNFVSDTEQSHATSRVGYGLLVGRDSRQVLSAPWVIKQLVRGGNCFPVWGTVDTTDEESSAIDVVNRWSFQAFITDWSEWKLLISNPLGARIEIEASSKSKVDHGVASQETDLITILKELFNKPEKFESFINSHLNNLIKSKDGITSSIRNPALCGLANYLWEEFEDAGFFESTLLSPLSPWTVTWLGDMRWALSVTRESLDGLDNPVFVLIVNPDGVEQFLVSRGERSFLGGLRGSSFRPPDGKVFSVDDVEKIVEQLCEFLPVSHPVDVMERCRASIPSAIEKPRASMMVFDPHCDRRELLRWLVRKLAQPFA